MNAQISTMDQENQSLMKILESLDLNTSEVNISTNTVGYNIFYFLFFRSMAQNLIILNSMAFPL